MKKTANQLDIARDEAHRAQSEPTEVGRVAREKKKAMDKIERHAAAKPVSTKPAVRAKTTKEVKRNA